MVGLETVGYCMRTFPVVRISLLCVDVNWLLEIGISYFYFYFPILFRTSFWLYVFPKYMGGAKPSKCLWIACGVFQLVDGNLPYPVSGMKGFGISSCHPLFKGESSYYKLLGRHWHSTMIVS